MTFTDKKWGYRLAYGTSTGNHVEYWVFCGFPCRGNGDFVNLKRVHSKEGVVASGLTLDKLYFFMLIELLAG
jgi:hypothetical protein